MNTHENRLKDFIYFLSISHSSILKIRSHLIISYMTLIILTLKSALPETSLRIFLNQAKGQQVQFGSIDIRQYFHLFPKAKHLGGEELSLLMGKYSAISILGYFLLYFLTYSYLVILPVCTCVSRRKRRRRKEQTTWTSHTPFPPYTGQHQPVLYLN